MAPPRGRFCSCRTALVRQRAHPGTTQLIAVRFNRSGAPRYVRFVLIGIHPTIVVMGVTGSGKTTVAMILAEQLGVLFADADDFHSDEAKAKMAAGQPLTDEDRAPWLVRLAEWLRSHPDGAVLACSALKRGYRDVLRTGADRLCFLHLAGEPAVVTARVANRT